MFPTHVFHAARVFVYFVTTGQSVLHLWADRVLTLTIFSPDFCQSLCTSNTFFHAQLEKGWCRSPLDQDCYQVSVLLSNPSPQESTAKI